MCDVATIPSKPPLSDDDDGGLEAKDIFTRFFVHDFPFDGGSDGRILLLDKERKGIGIGISGGQRAREAAALARVHVVGGPWDRNVKNHGVDLRLSLGYARHGTGGVVLRTGKRGNQSVDLAAESFLDQPDVRPGTDAEPAHHPRIWACNSCTRRRCWDVFGQEEEHVRALGARTQEAGQPLPSGLCVQLLACQVPGAEFMPETVQPRAADGLPQGSIWSVHRARSDQS